MLRALFEKRTITTSNSPWGVWPGDQSGMATWSGIPVDAQSSLQLLTVYGCVRLITDSISTLPVDVFRERADGSRQEANKPGWLMAPSVDLDFTEWCSQVLCSLLLWGNAYLVVLRKSSVIVELVPLDPASVTVVREAKKKVYRVNGIEFKGEMIHIKGIMMPGADVGMSPVEAARQSIGLGLATVEYGSKFFDSDGNMPGVIETPKALLPEQAKEWGRQWRRNRSRQGRGLPGVLTEGAQWKPTGVTNEQAQFLATRKFTSAEIAGQMFLVDPSDLGIPVEGTSLTYANLEQRNARRVQVTLLPWIIRIEKALSGLLAEPRYVKFNVQGLLRGDLSTRYASYQIGLSNGFLLREEVREFEDLPPVELPDLVAPEVPSVAA